MPRVFRYSRRRTDCQSVSVHGSVGDCARFAALTVCRQSQTFSENMGRSPSPHRPVNASSNPSVTGRTGSPSYENGTHCSCAANKGRPIIDSRRVLPGAGGERNRQYDSNSNSINSCSNSWYVGLSRERTTRAISAPANFAPGHVAAACGVPVSVKGRCGTVGSVKPAAISVEDAQGCSARNFSTLK